MSKQQIEKGKAGERELVRVLRPHLADVTRNLNQATAGGADLTGLPFALEVKRGLRPRFQEWWRQACGQAAATGQVPCLAYRPDYHPWRFVLPLGTVHPQFDPADTRLTVIVGLQEFVALVKLASGRVGEQQQEQQQGGEVPQGAEQQDAA